MRLREEEGRLQVYLRQADGSSRSSMGDEVLAGLLRGREGEVIVEQLGTDEVVAVDLDRPTTLLRLSLSESLRAERKRLDELGTLQPYDPVLFEYEIGPEGSTR